MAQLFLRYRKIMFSEINKIISDPWESEDILQNALIKLSDKVSLLRKLDERKRVCYAITTAKNLAKNHIRDKQNIQLCFFDDENPNLPDGIGDDIDIEQSIILKEQLKDLSAIWSKLDETSQRLLEGKYILNQSNDDLGKMLGIKPSSIRMMLTRARRKALSLMSAKEDANEHSS
ncbi:MAG: sigma-70 family RNA polymerase sigma factor [Enterococcus lemanii]|jgi:RNA polymerase sigma-70 factor (ECF subfamily)